MQSTTTIPILDLGPEVSELWDELNAAVQSVLRSGHFIMGPNVKAFEEEVAAYLGVKHAVSMNSGTDALVIGLRALGVGQGDEVITTPFTFFATAEAISAVGATPVFVDIDPRTYNINPTLIENSITPKTKAILPVHLYGQSADMDSIMAIARENELVVIEDVAQAFGGMYRGARTGTIGNAGAFSFFPSKNLGAYGDGGMLATNDERVAEQARMLRVHGSRKKYYNEAIGYNSRLDEIQAAILRVKLPHITRSNQGRIRVATVYDRLLSDMPGLVTPYSAPSGTHVYHQYTVRLTTIQRDEVQRKLAESGVQTMAYYPVPVHELPVYQMERNRLHVSASAATQVLSLPIWPQMDIGTQTRVVDALRPILS